MSGRIQRKFTALAKAGRKGLITFVMGGDPDLASSERLIAALPEAGADIIEIGMPFSDPMADGRIIQEAGIRALASGTRVKDILAVVARFRALDTDTPIVLMGYYNPVYHFGLEAFCAQAGNAGVDGIILVDLPPEEEEEFVSVASRHGLALIRLAAPTTGEERLIAMTKHAGGFLYYISVAGVTGEKSAEMQSLKQRVALIRQKTGLPVAVGFGIKTPAQAAEIAAFSDAVVVGSAIVDIIGKGSAEDALQFVRSLRRAMV